MKTEEIALKTPTISTKQTVWGISVFPNLSPTMTFERNVKHTAEILISKLDRKIAKQLRGISKNPRSVLKTDPSGLNCTDIWCVWWHLMPD